MGNISIKSLRTTHLIKSGGFISNSIVCNAAQKKPALGIDGYSDAILNECTGYLIKNPITQRLKLTKSYFL